jgi:hypothetical protein
LSGACDSDMKERLLVSSHSSRSAHRLETTAEMLRIVASGSDRCLNSPRHFFNCTGYSIGWGGKKTMNNVNIKVERRQLTYVSRYYSGFRLDSLKKPRKQSGTTSNNSAEIRTGFLLDTRLEFYRYTNLFGALIKSCFTSGCFFVHSFCYKMLIFEKLLYS